MSYPRHKNGHTDDGHLVNIGYDGKQRCPNCQSTNYRETVSREYCPDCKLECDYWGKGTNKVYENFLDRRHQENLARQKAEELQELRDYDTFHGTSYAYDRRHDFD